MSLLVSMAFRRSFISCCFTDEAKTTEEESAPAAAVSEAAGEVKAEQPKEESSQGAEQG